MSYTINQVPIIIPDADKLDADIVFTAIDPDIGGANSFTVPLSASGTGIPTHWGSFGVILQEAYNAMTSGQVALKNYVNLKSMERGRDEVPLDSVTSFIQQAKIGSPGTDFWAFCAQHSLQPIIIDD